MLIELNIKQRMTSQHVQKVISISWSNVHVLHGKDTHSFAHGSVVQKVFFYFPLPPHPCSLFEVFLILPGSITSYKFLLQNLFRTTAIKNNFIVPLFMHQPGLAHSVRCKFAHQNHSVYQTLLFFFVSTTKPTYLSIFEVLGQWNAQTTSVWH